MPKDKKLLDSLIKRGVPINDKGVVDWSGKIKAELDRLPPLDITGTPSLASPTTGKTVIRYIWEDMPLPGITRWLCQIYWSRGQLNEEQWAKFAKFCETHGFQEEPVPGGSWDKLEAEMQADYEFEQRYGCR